MVQCLGVGVGVSPIYPIKYPFPSYIGICAFLICCVGLDVAVGIGVVVCVAGIMSSSGVFVAVGVGVEGLKIKFINDKRDISSTIPPTIIAAMMIL